MDDADYEGVEQFRLRARTWLQTHMPRSEEGKLGAGAVEYEGTPDDERVARARMLQRRLFEGGFAGITFPREYGGQGLSAAHLRAFAEECAGYETPLWLNMSTLGAQAPTLLEYGTEAQKQAHIPAMLRGDEFWCQMLSEPSGGSDLAGLLTTAVRDGDIWLLNGSKIWTSAANLRDKALCLARTDWEVPKHKGLTMFIVDLRAPGLEIVPIRLANGLTRFCQEFLADVAVPSNDVVGEVNDGWTVASRLLFHERNMVGGGSAFVSVAKRRSALGKSNIRGSLQRELVDLARRSGPHCRGIAEDLVGEAHSLSVVRVQLIQRVMDAQRQGRLPGPAGSLMKLMTSEVSSRLDDIRLDLADIAGVICEPNDERARLGEAFLSRQTHHLGGGSSEMQRNAIAERLLGMPREPSNDMDMPYREVRQNVVWRRERPGKNEES
jgi:alkylation response protein AidB-like acyl-CoA dehydrogenase